MYTFIPISDFLILDRTGRDRFRAIAIAPRRLDALLTGMRHHLFVERAVQIGFGDEAGAHAVRR